MNAEFFYHHIAVTEKVKLKGFHRKIQDLEGLSGIFIAIVHEMRNYGLGFF